MEDRKFEKMVGCGIVAIWTVYLFVLGLVIFVIGHFVLKYW